MAKSATRSAKPAYRRVVVKVSGEALSGPDGFGIHQPTIDRIAKDVIAARALGIRLGVVVGGGNILRGSAFAKGNPIIREATAHYMGMTATVINGLALQDALEREGVVLPRQVQHRPLGPRVSDPPEGSVGADRPGRAQQPAADEALVATHGRPPGARPARGAGR